MNHNISKIYPRRVESTKIFEIVNPPSVQVINHSHDILSGPWLNEGLQFSLKFKSKTKKQKKETSVSMDGDIVYPAVNSIA